MVTLRAVQESWGSVAAREKARVTPPRKRRIWTSGGSTQVDPNQAGCGRELRGGWSTRSSSEMVWAWKTLRPALANSKANHHRDTSHGCFLCGLAPHCMALTALPRHNHREWIGSYLNKLDSQTSRLWIASRVGSCSCGFFVCGLAVPRPFDRLAVT